MESESLTITIAGRPFQCRRPTHGELDMGKLQRLCGVFFGYQKRIEDVEANPEPGAAEKIASFVAIAAEAAEKIREMGRRTLERIAGPEAAALLDAAPTGEFEATQRALSVADQLFTALVPPRALPK